MQGLKPSQLNALNRLFNRRFPSEDVYTIEQARELALLSRALGRQVGLLIDRKGRVQMVLVGEAGSILIPELPRGRTGQERLRGLRLLHTHLSPDGISQEDLMDMLFLRLDAVIALSVNPTGDPVQWQAAHLLPSGATGKPYHLDAHSPGTARPRSSRPRPKPWKKSWPGAARMRGKRRTRRAPCSFPWAAQPRILQERNLDELAELAAPPVSP